LLDEHGIEIRHTHESQLKTLGELTLAPNHSDPSDLMIIAQAITENITILSTDGQFPYYAKHGLKHIPAQRKRR
jgi:PIN domain nuclease of toxin-antitoxin system